MDPHLRIHAINIYVRDQERSLRFYLDQLGFQVAFDAKLQSGERWVAVTPPDGSAILSLIAPKPKSPEAKFIGRSTHVVLVTEDVPAKFREWSKRGVKFMRPPRLKRIKYSTVTPAPPSRSHKLLGEEESVWGSVVVYFKDIDGNSFALISFDEITRTVEAERRAVAAKLESERRAAQELEIAWQVQAKLFPQNLPRLNTLEYTGRCIPARKVGGDYYDILDLGRGRFGLVVGDVVGKGIAAALLMANLQANVRSQSAIAFDQPQRLLQSVNQLFSDNTPEGNYATLFFAEYDDNTGMLRYANCGHLPALVIRADETVERLGSTATVVGLFKEWDCEIAECQLDPGDTLALYTDGVTESFNDAGDEYGEDRLIDALKRGSALDSQSLLDAIVEEINRFSANNQHDDVTLIVAKRASV